VTERAVRVYARDGGGPPPRRPDGGLYRFELIDKDGRWRAYADDPDALVAELLPSDYLRADAAFRLRARTDFAVRVQVICQATLIADRGLVGCDPEQVAVLRSDRATPPQVRSWSAPVPLILVEGAYQPGGPLPRPEATPPGVIVWIDPRDDEALLRSLHNLGWIVLAERTDERTD
jgi:hypothetical protein